MPFLGVLILNLTGTAYALLKNGTRDFQNTPSVWEIDMFLCDDQWKFQTFQHFNFEINFRENENLFQKTGVPFFSWNHYDLKHIISIQNCCEKPMLRQIEWRLQNGPIIKSGVLPVTTLFFWKICFSFRTS